MLTAVVTLGTAALTLLAPLESTLHSDSRRIGEGTVTVDKTPLGNLPVGANGLPSRAHLAVQLDAFETVVKTINEFWLTMAKLPPRAVGGLASKA